VTQEWRFSNDSCGVAHEGDQVWLFDDKASVTGVKVIGSDGAELVAFGPAPADLEILNAKFSQGAGVPLPATFEHCPHKQGGKIFTMLQPQDILSAPDWDGDGLPSLEYGPGTLTLDSDKRTQHSMPGVDALCFVAGKPNALYLLDYRTSFLFRYSTTTEDWIEHYDVLPDVLHDQNKKWADAIVATAEGIGYTGRNGPVWVSLPILGEARSSICPDAVCVGAPGISHSNERSRARSALAKSVFWPVTHDGKLYLAQKMPSGKDWKKIAARIEGELPPNLEFAPPVISAIGNLWICREGILMLPRRAAEPVFRLWPNGLKAVPQARPIIDDAKTMWTLAEAPNSTYALVQLLHHGFNPTVHLETPFFSAGERFYTADRAFTLDDSGKEQAIRGEALSAMPGFRDPFFVPLQTFKPATRVEDPTVAAGITLGLQVDDQNVRMSFLSGGARQPQRLTRLLMDMPGVPVVDLKTAFDIKSAASLATFRYRDRLYVHSRERNQCYSWPIAFS